MDRQGSKERLVAREISCLHLQWQALAAHQAGIGRGVVLWIQNGAHLSSVFFLVEPGKIIFLI